MDIFLKSGMFIEHLNRQLKHWRS